MRKFTSLIAAAAVILPSVGLGAPTAAAQGRHHGGWGHRHHDRVGAGDVLGGLLVIGTIAAIASAASRDQADRRDRDRNRDERYVPPYRDWDDRDYPRYDSEAPRDMPPAPYGRGDVDVDDRDAVHYEPDSPSDFAPGRSGSEAQEARAADACGWAVEAEMGEDAYVDAITDTQPNADGLYVTGTASRLGGEVRSFGCSYRNGRVVDVRFGE